jgi:hypothetical protein
MDTIRVKVKIGDNEFDAEGPTETVQAQFKAFQEIVSTMPRIVAPSPPRNDPQILKQQDDVDKLPHVPIEKILHVSGRVVSLTALPKSAADAALLIMLGQKDLRNNVSVTGQEIGDGLDQSGLPVPRVDRVMDKALEEAFVLKTGIKRGTRYRLTNQGLSKTLNIAKDLIASLP